MNSKAIEKMDVKKSRLDGAARTMNGKKAIEFVGDVKQELKKVDWTSKEELKVYTKIVLASTFLFGMLVYIIDLVVQGALGGINFLVRAIVG
jgi:preprotein translocase subunit SecE